METEGIIELDDWEDDGSELAVGSPVATESDVTFDDDVDATPTVSKVQEMYSEKKGEMLESFYSQTVGAVFVWTLETLIVVALHYCIYLVIDATISTVDGGIIIMYWCCSNILLCTLLIAGANTIIAFTERKPGIFSRHYMMCTQALCGVISCVSIVFSAVMWKASRSDTWQKIFVQSDSTLVPLATIGIVVGNNVVWLLSLILTYSCTPFGQSNVAFMHIPVAAMLAIFVILVNEVATNGVVLCQEYPWTLFSYGTANVGIISSFILHVLSAVEFDPLQQFPAFMHSSVDTNIRFDIYSLIHGLIVIAVVAAYGTIAKLSQTTFFGLLFVLLFTLTVTILHSVDLGFLMSVIFQSDDEEEQRIRALQTAFAVSFVEARDIHEAITRKKHKKPKKGLMDVTIEPERPPPFNPAAQRPPSPKEEEPKKKHSKLRLRHRHNHSDKTDIRTLGNKLHEANKRKPLPTGLSVFPHIPVALRRTVN